MVPSADRYPEQPRRHRGDGALLAHAEIDMGERCLHGDGGGQHRGVGLGDPRLEIQHEDAGERNCRDEAGSGTEQAQARGIAGQHRDGGGDEGDGPEHPYRRRGALAADGHGQRLQPIDADRLQITRLVLKADVDQLAGRDHLLRRLDVARFIAVDRRQSADAGRKCDQAQHDQHEALRQVAAVAVRTRQLLERLNHRRVLRPSD